jgi:S1-C subfamily serine protease
MLPRLSGYLLAAAVLLGLASIAAVPVRSRAEDVNRDKEIAAIEKQIAELNRRLAELRKNNGAATPPAAAPAVEGTLDPEWVKQMTWRCIGPATMGGRITAVAVSEADPSTYWVATASGGLVKTVNNGVTFEHQFDHEATVSIGAVAVAPSDRNVVWVGTGENNPRNSVSYGDGVYKSTDGGKSWKNMGLKKSFQIGRIAIHPSNPNVVYVGALGRLYGPNPERGVYKTVNGGESWEQVLFVNDKTGIIDLQMDPSEPETLLAAAWERQRDGFDSHPGNEVPLPDGYDRYDPAVKWGPGSALYKTTDGGKHWKKLVGGGLPTVALGRIGIDYYRTNPKTVFAIIDTEKSGTGTPPPSVYLGVQGENADGGGAKLNQVNDNSPAAKAGLKAGDVIKAIDKKEIKNYEDLVQVLRGHKAGDKLAVTVQRDKETKEFTVTLEDRQEGGPASRVVYAGFQGEEVEGGVRVTQISPEAPASKDGLKVDDVIKAVDKKPVTTLQQLIDLFQGHKAGDKLTFTVTRDRATQDIVVTLAERQGGGAGAGREPRGVFLGIQGEGGDNGIRLTQVLSGGPGDKAGLKVGDVVKALDKKAVTKMEEMLEALREHKVGDKVNLTIQRDKETKEVAVTLEPRPGPGGVRPRNPSRPYGTFPSGQRENVQDQQGPDGWQTGGVYKSTDGGETWARVNSLNPRPMYFSRLRVDPNDEKYVYVCGVALYRSADGGKTFKGDGGSAVHADQHALWIDPRDGRHMLVGTDGGFYVTYDRMERWDHVNNMALGQFYHVAVDTRRPYSVYGGLQDNGSWGGPSLSLDGRGPINEDWAMIGGGDGFVCRVDQNDPNVVYMESQDGNMFRRNLKTGDFAAIRPRERTGGAAYRFNWNTPFILSSHNSHIFYAAGNYVFRSVEQGADLQVISPEITRTKRGSGTALAESPRNPEVLWVGTDDGALWVRVIKDGGAKWTNVTPLPSPPGGGEGSGVRGGDRLPGPRWVASIEPSRTAEGRCYVVFDGHRSDDDEPYVYVTDNYGETWKSLRGNLPWGSTRVLREDPVNTDLLYLGTEFGIWASLNRGASWTKLNNNLPTVAVHEVAIHPTAGEIVAATHGRSLWVLDVTALRQMKPSVLAATAHLYQPNTVVRWRSEPEKGSAIGNGHHTYHGQNPPSGAQVFYSLGKKAEKVSLKVLDYTGKTMRELKDPQTSPGLHRATWDLTRVVVRLSPPGVSQESVPAGMYKLVLTVDGQEYAQGLRVEADPGATGPFITEDEDEDKEKGKEPLRIDF